VWQNKLDDTGDACAMEVLAIKEKLRFWGIFWEAHVVLMLMYMKVASMATVGLGGRENPIICFDDKLVTSSLLG
jgi:hypothetical protein